MEVSDFDLIEMPQMGLKVSYQISVYSVVKGTCARAWISEFNNFCNESKLFSSNIRET